MAANTEDVFDSELKMLKMVTDALPIGLCYVYHREFMWVNQFMLDLTGYTQEELLHHKTRELYQTDEEYDRIEKLLTTTKSGVVTDIIKKNGSKVTVMIHAITNEKINPSAGDFQQPLVKTFSIIPDDIAKILTNGCSAV